MKKTDLEKFKGKKLDIRKSHENALGRHAKAAAAAATKKAELGAPTGLMNRLLGQLVEKK
jgi:hypothetical protein